MNYMSNIQFIKKASNKRELYSHQYTPNVNYPDLIIKYPGKKLQGDYVVCFYGDEIPHIEIATAIFNSVNNDNYQHVMLFLEDIYKNGLMSTYPLELDIHIDNRLINIDEFKNLIYWIILQEDINYPGPLLKGRKMPITRYLEAIVAKICDDVISLNQVIQRTKNPSGIKKIVNTAIPDDLQDLLNSL